MRHAASTMVALAFVVPVTGCPERGGDMGGSHGHAHGEDADHAHGDGDVHGDGDAHDDPGAASEGVVARITEADSEETVGYLRLKLHDDEGDLEVWLARDAAFSEPFDLPLDARITVTFTDEDDRAVELAVRNRDQNEDEDGKPNIRDGKTNYFIFPGDSGADASWLQGADFRSTTKVSFSAGGEDYTTPAFVLRPHTHGSGHSH